MISRVRKVGDGWFAFWCPGCEGMHAIPAKPQPNGWDFNGNLEAPTFNPSILITGVQSITDEEAARILAGEPFEPKPRRCHSFVKDGYLEFCGDCSHAMAGQRVQMRVEKEY